MKTLISLVALGVLSACGLQVESDSAQLQTVSKRPTPYPDGFPTCVNGGDENYRPPFPQLPPNGIVVAIDEAHLNEYTEHTHWTRAYWPLTTLPGKYAALAKLLRHAGYTVVANAQKFDQPGALDGIDLLIVGGAAGALTHRRSGRWREEAKGAALTDSEITALTRFVSSGGGLLVTINHAPLDTPMAGLLGRLGMSCMPGSVVDLPTFSNGLTAGSGQIVSTSSTLVQQINAGVSALETGGGCAAFGKPEAAVTRYSGWAVSQLGNTVTPVPWAINSFALDYKLRLGDPGGRVFVSTHAGDITSQVEFNCQGSTQPAFSPLNSQPDQHRWVLNIVSALTE